MSRIGKFTETSLHSLMVNRAEEKMGRLETAERHGAGYNTKRGLSTTEL